MPEPSTQPGTAALGPIPAPLMTMLQLKKVTLTENGAVQCRSEPGHRTTWRLRFRENDEDAGCRRHRSLMIGSDTATADAVRALIDQWRAERDETEVAADRAQRARRAGARERRLLRQVAMMSAGHSRDQRRQIGKDFDAAVAAGPVESLSFAVRLPYSYPKPARGQPRRAALW